MSEIKVLSRQRWTMAAEHLDSAFFKNVSFDFYYKTIYFNYYNLENPSDQQNPNLWIKTIENETLTFTNYDELGNEIKKQIFKGLELIGHTSCFSYDGDFSTTDLIVSYRDVI